jgi:hypothetical protein
MKTYVVNLVVDTKNTDIYDKVALNKFPIIIKCKAEAELKDILSQELAQKFIQDHIKSQRVFDSAEWFVRCVYEDDVREIVWKVSELNNPL